MSASLKINAGSCQLNPASTIDIFFRMKKTVNKSKLAILAAAISLPLIAWGCSAPTNLPPAPGKPQVDKAKEAKETVEKRNTDLQKQVNDQNDEEKDDEKEKEDDD